jgi:hypothetical protein
MHEKFKKTRDEPPPKRTKKRFHQKKVDKFMKKDKIYWEIIQMGEELLI